MIELNGTGLDLSKVLVLNSCITSKPAEGCMWVLITGLAKKFVSAFPKEVMENPVGLWVNWI